MEPCLNEPLNLCTKSSRLSDGEESPVHRTVIDYDEACLATRVSDAQDNCDKTTTTTNGTSSSPSGIDGDGVYDGFVRPGESGEVPGANGTFEWQNKDKNPNLLLQQQYFLLHQHQQHQQQLMNNAPDGSLAKMHLDKYMKLTNRYLDTMSPFFQQFTPLMNQNLAGQPSTSVQAAATAAATLLLTSNLNNSQQHQNDGSETPPSPSEPSEGNNSLLNQDSVRFFLHKLIEHNFLQQLQQQQQINDLINNNNHQNANNNNNSSYKKSPSSNDGDGNDFYNQHMMSSPSNHHTKTFLDFLKNAAAAQSASGLNHTNNRNQQSYKRASIEHHNSKNSSSSIPSDSAKESIANDKKKPHIKKPLNAFMLYMKEMRAQVVAECTLKESAAINQILGRKWHALGREEQAKYYELARRERQLHMQMYPDWSSRTNATRGKKRKRKQEPSDGGNSMKKCRARYGLDQQNQWCKPCRRKKKCIRYKEAEEARDLENHGSDDNLGSCGSVDDAQTPDDDTESLNQSMSSPGGLSGLSSLQSPSTSLASPINLLASPSTPNPIMSHHHDDHQMVASLVNQLQRNKSSGVWDGKLQSHQKNGMMLQDEIKKEQQKQLGNDVQIKTEPMDQSQNHSQLLQQHHRLDPFFYDKLPIIHRNPVGANPRDVNNPLSVNQLTRRDFQPNMGGGGYYSPFQKPLMAHPLAHPTHHQLAQFQAHAANFANFQLAAAAAAAQQAPGGGKDAGPSNGTHHRDDGNAISVT